jgi:hypothetical protein
MTIEYAPPETPQTALGRPTSEDGRDGSSYPGGGYPTLPQAVRGARLEFKVIGEAEYAFIVGVGTRLFRKPA